MRNCLIFRDITDRRNSEVLLKSLNQELEERVSERTRELEETNKRLMEEAELRGKAEELLRLNEQELKAIFQSAEDIIVVKDRQHRFTRINPAMEKFMGVSQSEMVGKTAYDFVQNADADAITEAEIRALDGEMVEFERSWSINGTNRVFHTICMPLSNEDNEIRGILVTARDVTERKEAIAKPIVQNTEYYSPLMHSVMTEARYAATSDIVVLLLGESGTGKDYLAKWIHDHSKRKTGPFFILNCAGIPKDLAESELFGHETGSFTGARGRKRGLLELAEGGTLLLNEIGELSLGLQSKLLTFLDTKEFLRLGGERKVRVNARIIAATHRDLGEEVRAGRFLNGLYYRLNVLCISLPPLRARLCDLPILVKDLIAQITFELQISQIPIPDSEILEKLEGYNWPGNIRELKNVLERSVMISNRDKFDLLLQNTEHEAVHPTYTINFENGKSLKAAIDELKQWMCLEMLRQTKGNKRKAARQLGISRDALHRYLTKFNVAHE